ncbi:porin family protein [Fusobacterium necrophorum]|uniref:Outer membrane protein n=1 Tax=Fusobacterium necrophorum DJ-2 TaxID=1441737 RepID=A0AB73C633_9FUSO|nr:hypothetical protein [Fusobacterium necrophorum]KDE64530.1 hypothetical protein FUSO4_07860 [Fusobacterium necrophorum DJ-1]KDE73791.1 hypothetical protein FUSO8_00415 [Fusobacterium necrophorum DJ-2]MBR8821828.1 hypothetical protein [Fusobacterium necrophorum]MCF0161884.1 hypothetical protein [Fusobacterium necrophorum]
MRKHKMIMVSLFLISSFSFSEVYEERRERGIDKMNFYIPTEKQNKLTSFAEVDIRDDKNIYQWTVAEGYQNLNQTWDFQYKIEKEYHKDKKTSQQKTKIWDNEISFVKYHNFFKIQNHIWQHKSTFGIKHYEGSTFGKRETQYYKMIVGQRFSSFFRSTRIGTYLEFEFLANKIFDKQRDGYSFLTSMKSFQNLGYGIQWLNALESEYLHYNQYRNGNRNKYESTLRWTYEWNENFAFSPEVLLKIEKYHGNKKGKTSEFVIGPNLLYTKDIKENVRIYGKVGLPLFRSDKNRSENYRHSKNQIAIYGKIGIEYIF